MIKLETIKKNFEKINIEVISIKELYNDYKFTLKDNDVNITRKINIAKNGILTKAYYSLVKEYFKQLKGLEVK